MIRRDVKEEKAIVLDFLPNGYPFDSRPMHKKTAIAQAIGKEHFILLELVPKKGTFLQPYEEVYMGDGKRDKIHHILSKLQVDKLTQTARLGMQDVIEKIVDSNERRFVDFFNRAMPINTRRHQVELIPGIGKKHMWEIIEEREKKHFESFEELKSRVKLIPDPKKAVIKRILAELNDDDKYKLFVEV